MTSRVIFRKTTYDYRQVRRHFFEMADSLAPGLIKPGSRVLIKPNLLAPAGPESAMLTHPSVVRAACEYVLERGARPQVSDSPAMGSFEKIMETSGIGDAVAGLGVECRPFKESVAVTVGQPFGSLELAADALQADVVINLPKLKTHSQMLLTLGVKNMFGCVVGLRKPEWHFRTGVDREMFARLLVQVYASVRPGLTVVDGVLAMEGQGPGKGGTPKDVGLLVGGVDAVGVDRAICSAIGMDPMRLPTNRAARESDVGGSDLAIEGDVPSGLELQLPEETHLVFGPKALRGLMRRHLVQRPVADQSVCRLCGECWRYCPAKAITRKKEGLRFDYEACIRCYCCVEVCPVGALSASEPLGGRIVRKLARRTSGLWTLTLH